MVESGLTIEKTITIFLFFDRLTFDYSPGTRVKVNGSVLGIFKELMQKP